MEGSEIFYTKVCFSNLYKWLFCEEKSSLECSAQSSIIGGRRGTDIAYVTLVGADSVALAAVVIAGETILLPMPRNIAVARTSCRRVFARVFLFQRESE